jgi:hypothetical protein
MRAVAAESLPATELVIFEDAGKMIAWLRANLAKVDLISLDHDLPLRCAAGNRAADCGTGREVADYLSGLPPTCPVIVHSSNDPAASGMYFALTKAGWTCVRVYPSHDTEWITGAWAIEARRGLDR